MTRQFGERQHPPPARDEQPRAAARRRGDAEAEAIYRRALAISQSATGPEHPRVADQMHKLAGALTRLRRLAEAETLARAGARR